MVERVLRMHEAAGSMPATSTFLPLAGREERGGRAPRFVLLRAIDAFSIRHTHTGCHSLDDDSTCWYFFPPLIY